jgi:hypothetical protein
MKNRDARNIVRFDGDIFYYQKGLKRVSQFHMSTGENLLFSILNSIDKRNIDRNTLTTPCLLLNVSFMLLHIHKVNINWVLDIFFLDI